jgi:hypothetical protein
MFMAGKLTAEEAEALKKHALDLIREGENNSRLPMEAKQQLLHNIEVGPYELEVKHAAGEAAYKIQNSLLMRIKRFFTAERLFTPFERLAQFFRQDSAASRQLQAELKRPALLAREEEARVIKNPGGLEANTAKAYEAAMKILIGDTSTIQPWVITKAYEIGMNANHQGLMQSAANLKQGAEQKMARALDFVESSNNLDIKERGIKAALVLMQAEAPVTLSNKIQRRAYEVAMGYWGQYTAESHPGSVELVAEVFKRSENPQQLFRQEAEHYLDLKSHNQFTFGFAVGLPKPDPFALKHLLEVAVCCKEKGISLFDGNEEVGKNLWSYIQATPHAADMQTLLNKADASLVDAMTRVSSPHTIPLGTMQRQANAHLNTLANTHTDIAQTQSITQQPPPKVSERSSETPSPSGRGMG